MRFVYNKYNYEKLTAHSTFQLTGLNLTWYTSQASLNFCNLLSRGILDMKLKVQCSS